MKKVYVNEKWCLGCHLCEYFCAYASACTEGGADTRDMARVLRDIKINPRIKIEERDGISFAVSCRHCREPLCVKGCITGALTPLDTIDFPLICEKPGLMAYAAADRAQKLGEAR